MRTWRILNLSSQFYQRTIGDINGNESDKSIKETREDKQQTQKQKYSFFFDTF